MCRRAPELHGQCTDHRGALHQLPAQELVLGRGLVKRADEAFDVGFQAGDLLCVGSPKFLELADLLAQPLLAVRSAAAGADRVVELVLQVGVPLGERVARDAGLGLDGGDGLGDLLLVRRVFGPEILPLWRWKPGSDVAGGDRVAEIRLGQQYLTLAMRTDVDGEGDIGFDVLLPCPADDECTGYAWAPAYSVTCLYRALNGDMDNDEDIVCTVHGTQDNEDQDDDPEGRADLEPQAMEAIHG
jgi:hypothetical protein